MNEIKLYFYLLILTTIFLPGALTAQKWVSTHNRWYTVGSLQGERDLRFAYLFSDSIELNSRYYFTLYNTMDSTFQDLKTTNTLLREEKGIVYRLLDKVNYSEEIMYNFNLNRGDSITYKTFSGETVVQVVAVDTIELLDGSKRKRWSLSLKNRPSEGIRYWVAGIGATMGATFNPANMYVSDLASLSCYFFKGQYVYGQQSTCPNPFRPGPVSTQEIKELKGIQLIQNSGDGNILFRLEDPGKYSCKLYNALGGVVQSHTAVQGDNRLSLTELPKGIYFLQVYELESQKQKTLKVLRQ
ncbi:T9SS type A sorting domain-containing protein [Haliscomenobacter hydrossis]|uniref:Secretion system C-terminal sorting domain-containing protein n=1 Tax=Haliscomenobacter hydrossis (strain ATCC 27775 / DSM 1100 / LMG 10767 / O) TaxID=760192 RepID=F4KPY5_HALH1|nr:T9SS type A sorting domain-containing protein [Haliscomenobacter hydrossis]AEE53189.1 hypothetical protein Halhy_5364 [Haliscomenobacter hydrossis DSM 1100]